MAIAGVFGGDDPTPGAQPRGARARRAAAPAGHDAAAGDRPSTREAATHPGTDPGNRKGDPARRHDHGFASALRLRHPLSSEHALRPGPRAAHPRRRARRRRRVPVAARRPLRALDDRAMDLASQDAQLKAALFRFVDVVPACRSLDDLART